MYYEQRSNGLAQIKTTEETYHVLFKQLLLVDHSYPLIRMLRRMRKLRRRLDVVDVTADADAATTAEAAAADNHTAKGAPSGLPIFL